MQFSEHYEAKQLLLFILFTANRIVKLQVKSLVITNLTSIITDVILLTERTQIQLCKTSGLNNLLQFSL